MLCKICGKEIENDKPVCCDNHEFEGRRSWFITFILSWFTGIFGFHRFYTGYVKVGIIQLLTLGGVGIWAFIDLIFICTGNFKTKDNKPLIGYVKSLGIASIFVFFVMLVRHQIFEFLDALIKIFIK